MRGVGVGVQQADGDRLHPAAPQPPGRRAAPTRGSSGGSTPSGRQPLVHLGGQLGQRRGRSTHWRYRCGRVWRASAQQVAEPAGGHEPGAGAAPLEQRVGGDRRAVGQVADRRPASSPRASSASSIALDHPPRLVVGGGRDLGRGQRGRRATTATSVNVPPISTPISAATGGKDMLCTAWPRFPTTTRLERGARRPRRAASALRGARPGQRRPAGDLPAAVRRARPSSTSRTVRAAGGEIGAGADRPGSAPELGEEIEGIAAGSGLDAELIGALNARTELLAAGRGECSTVACLGNADRVRSADRRCRPGTGTMRWPTAGCAGRSTTPDGRRVDTHDRGRHRRQDRRLQRRRRRAPEHPRARATTARRSASPVHVLNRRVLDEADDASTALTIARRRRDVGVQRGHGGRRRRGRRRACCTVELSPAGPGFVTPDERGVLAHTNHFLAEPGSQADTMVRVGPDSVLRLDHARRALAQRGRAAGRRGRRCWA